jgi:hypothetical protein
MISWDGPGKAIKAELSPLAAGTLAMILEFPAIAEYIANHPRQCAEIIELHDGIAEALQKYGERYWQGRSDEVFPMTGLPQKKRAIFAKGVARVTMLGEGQ